VLCDPRRRCTSYKRVPQGYVQELAFGLELTYLQRFVCGKAGMKLDSFCRDRDLTVKVVSVVTSNMSRKKDRERETKENVDVVHGLAWVHEHTKKEMEIRERRAKSKKR
jgi:hypothetical protein